MLKSGGYSVISEPGKRTIEHDTIGCAHCGAITFMRPGFGQPPEVVVMRADGTVYTIEARKCFKCDGYICPRKKCQECRPKMKMIEEEEKLQQTLLKAGA